MIYKTGIETTIIPSEKLETTMKSQSIPVYVGFAPVHQLADYTNAVNKPILLENFDDAVKKVGYTDDWSYTLCEAIDAHFKSGEEIVSPIIVINALDPTTQTQTGGNQTVTFTSGVGILANAKHIIHKTISIDSLTLGEDFTATYSPDGDTITITGEGLTGEKEVEYSTINTSNMNKTLIIGSDDKQGHKKGLEALDYVYDDLNIVPSIILCTGYSHEPDVREAMLKHLDGFADEYRTYMYTDIPADSTTNTPAKAISWKTTNGYTDYRETVNFPMGKKGNKIYHLSTLRAIESQKLDIVNEVPSVPPSNKPLSIDSMVLKDGTPIRIEFNDAKLLESEGIATMVKKEGTIRTWGGTTAAFNFRIQDTLDRMKQDETTVRSVRTITNAFARRYFDDLHSALTPGKALIIINSFQTYLDGLQQSQKILYGKITFKPEKNTVDKLIKGQFYFDIRVTAGLYIRYINAMVQWTPEGLYTFFGGETT